MLNQSFEGGAQRKLCSTMNLQLALPVYGVLLAAVLVHLFGPVRGFDSLRFLRVDALSFGQVKIIFFRFGTAAQPAAMGTLDGFWFFFLVERIIAAFSLTYWPGLHSVSGFASGLH